MISLLVNVNNNMYSHIATQTPPYTDLGTHHLISGGGGVGARVFVACKLFFYLREKTIFFFGDQRPTIYFLCFVKEIFCRMLPLLCTLPFGVFSGQHIFFINFDNKLFFSAHIFNKLFFLTFVATNYLFQFFLGPPPPQISNGASLISGCHSSVSEVKTLVERVKCLLRCFNFLHPCGLIIRHA